MKEVHILHLYPNELNTYGDHGNVLTLKRRLEWHGFKPLVHYQHPGSALSKEVDIVIGGGGQDSAQSDVQVDILRIGDKLHALAQAHIPMLLICGTYQLFGHRFVTHNGEEIKGIGLLNAETIAGPKRMIGNVKVESDFGTLFGFENHSGQTFLATGQPAFGKVLRGGGNNGKDKTEGSRTMNVFGTYMHGPFLPNNPNFCDELIKIAVQNKYGEFKPVEINDSLAQLARSGAERRRY
jgi:CobQ-like glutamine amidotransferase family enzyme